MNYDPQLTTSIAVIMAIFATFMWGSWFVSLKYIKEFPLDGFYITLFITSFILVWLVGFTVDGTALISNIRDVYEVDPSRVWVSLACGISYVFGMRISLLVMQTIGLSLTQPISSSINIGIGIAVSTIIGGVPENYSFPHLITAVVFFIGAVFLAMMAARYRVNPKETSGKFAVVNFTMNDMWKAIGLILLASLISPAYTFGLSYGLKSVTQSNGLSVLPYMSLLVTGALIGSLIISGGTLTVRKQWMIVFKAPFSIHKWELFQV